MSNFFIPKPCHENWNTMTPQEKGRLCDVCTKVVVDFTKKTPVEIDKIMNEAEGSVCGNFNVTQLNQEAQMKVFRKPTNLFNRNFKYFAMSVFGFFALNKKAEAQLKGKVAIRGDVSAIDYHDTNSEVTTLKGTISKQDGKPAGGANIKIMSGNVEIAITRANANGTYSIKIEPGKIVNRKVNVTVDHSYYETKVVNDLYISKAENKLNVTLDEMYMLLGEVAFVEPVVKDTLKVETMVVDTIKGEPVIDNVTVVDPVETNTTTCNETYMPGDTATNETNEKNAVETPVNNLLIRPEDITATIYPNPAGNLATVYCNKESAYVIGIYTENGKLMKTFTFEGSSTQLDVTNFERGNYFITVNSKEGYSNTL
ncbi:MAG TPA: T9SS type A sorting domain-containing protein, partial [Flavobacteriales bacterium]|nr:T9SS type A sorting domain-containing protein [Flavobacteriales bacterium]